MTPRNAPPRCTCTVTLLSRVFRPYLFEVAVIGEPPHPWRVTYKIAAPDEDAAAVKGMQMFSHQFVPWMIRQQFADISPKAKLQ